MSTPQRLSFGCGVFDDAFGGGLPPHGLHEICGEAGAGKTQMCLQLATQAVILGGKCCYLTSGEGLFPIKRLEQLAESAARRPGSTLSKYKIMEGVLIKACSSVDALMDTVDSELLHLMESEDIRLVVIDSVAGAFRTDERFRPPTNGAGAAAAPKGGTSGSAGRSLGQQRSRDLFLFAAHLRRLSFLHDAPVVVTNQATALFESDANPEYAHTHADMHAAFPDLRVKPAFGLSWASCVNQRIMLQRRAACPDIDLSRRCAGDSDDPGSSWRRDAVLMLSPCSPMRSVEFCIYPSGVKGVEVSAASY